MDDYANDTLSLMDSLEIERAVIGGLSMGGYATFAIHRLAPERIEGLILADTKAGADTEEGIKSRRALLDVARAKGASAVAEQMFGKLLGETSRRERPELTVEVRRTIESNPIGGIEAAIYALMHRPDSTPDLLTIECPTLVVVGEEDTVTPLAEAEVLQKTIKAAKLVRLPRAGHLTNVEAPEEFSNTISKWVASLP
jgi:pimeloyl-ACP methyl ester carboxylesterase